MMASSSTTSARNAATALPSVSLLLIIAAASAFAPPSGSIRQLPAASGAPRHRDRTPGPLFLQSKKSAFLVKSDAAANDTDALLSTLAADDLLDPPAGSNGFEPALAAEGSPIRPLEVVGSTAVAPSDAAGGSAEAAGDSALSGDGLFWRGAVVALCALWASNFACAKLVMAQPGVDTSLYAVARFALAALSLLPGSLDAARKGSISWETTKGALVCGSWVAFGYLGQLIGLMTTTPSRACVICSLNCIFVAIVAELARVSAAEDRGYASAFELKQLIPALIAVAGVAIIELKGAAGDPTIGDLICFAQPIGFGMGYLQLEELMRKQPSAALPVSAIKLLVVAAASLVFFEASPHAAADLAADVGADGVVEAARFGLTVPDFAPIASSPTALAAIFYTGLVTTSLALWVESVAFQRVPATDASIILTTEPLFAAAVSALLVGETFGASDAVGAFFIVGACIYAIKMGEGEEVCDVETAACVMEDT